MNLNGDSRTRLRVTSRTDVDPGDEAVIRLRIDATWYACTWQAAATEDEGVWTRVALTDDFFAGYSVPLDDVDGAHVITRGHHQMEGEVTPNGGDSVVVYAGDLICE